MKYILFFLLLIPVYGRSQEDIGYAKFLLADGSVVRGSSTMRLYERLVPVYSMQTNSSTNSTIIRFTMINEPAAAVLRDQMRARTRLRAGEIHVTFQSMDKLLVRYKINMEDIAVEEVTDMNGKTTIQLHATRIGWTYYSYTKSGAQSVSSKTGWDERTNTSWTMF